MQIERSTSFADDVRFELHMSQPNGGSLAAVLRGGYGSENPPRSTNARAITMRGQQGIVISTGDSNAIYWVEDDKPYAITGNLTLDDTLAVAEQSDTLNLAAWNQRLSDIPEPPTNEDQNDARDTLKKYFQRLSDERYGDAVTLYGGSYKELRKLNPDIDPDDHDALFEAACTDNGYACLSIAHVTRADTVNANKFQFDVEFRDDDGDIFSSKGQTRFTYTVTRSDGTYRVQDLPVLSR
jgi:hypothetical protein